MAADRAPVVVSSWNEWDPLRHVIVGRADGTMVQAPEPAMFRDWPDEGFPRGTYGPLPAELVAAANVQLDYFVKVLTDRGIRVDRPRPLDFSQTVSTPDWEQRSMFGCLPVRDVLVTLGNEILEATMSYRSRWFEYLAYRPLLESYFHADENMRWEAAPKPRLTERSYRSEFWDQFEALSFEEKVARVRRNELILTDTEPLFDAADIGRFGRDLFVQLSLVTNRSGIRWLTQHLPEHRVHPVTFGNSHPLHIDATLVPLRPGLVLHCGERTADPDLLQFFKANDWEVVTAAPARHEVAPPLSPCSRWLSMNTLSLDENTVCVEASEHAQLEQLDALGFDVVPIPFWDVAPFGGGLHCATLDIHREGAMQDYFPRRSSGF